MLEITFVIIKPDAINRGLIGEIITRFERKELTITRMEMRHKSEKWCREHYNHLVGIPVIYVPLIEFMTSRPLIGVEFYGTRANDIARKLTGCTDSVEAEPGTIRGDFGTTPVNHNVVHVSDSQVSAKLEIELFFDRATDIKV